MENKETDLPEGRGSPDDGGAARPAAPHGLGFVGG